MGFPSETARLRDSQWQAAFAQALSVVDDELLGRFYAEAARQGKFPTIGVQCRVGHEHQLQVPSNVTVVATRRELEALISVRRPVLLVTPEDSEVLVERWQLRPAERSVRTELSYVASGPSVPVLDRFPALRLRIDPDRISGLELVGCTELRLETLTEAGRTSEPVELHGQDRVIYWMVSLSDAELLDLISSKLDLRLTAEDRDAVLAEREARQVRDRIIQVRSISGTAEKLLAAVGVNAIRQHIPISLIRAMEARRGILSDRELAQLASIVYGVNLLQEFRADFEDAGFEPPRQWAGSRTALQFVRQLGFESEYAGSEDERPPEVLKIEGPSALPALHQFQAAITENVKRHLGLENPGRGLLSLPTGAGKTRIVVQALVEQLRDGPPTGPVLWVAQSEELCEQAVQSWAEVWHALGPKRRLYVCRLWSQNEVEPFEQETQVVVATIQKLGNCVDVPDYDWLKESSCVVIDEAHSATEPSYTRMLEWQGIGRNRARCPLIGLTATPFRGHSEEETERLVRRFGGVRLDTRLDDDPYRYLQHLGVLARVKHQLLGGVDVDLSDQELDEVKRFQRLPASVSAKIAANVDRNTQLVQDIMSNPRDWPTIVFAASVEHAQALAALLCMEGAQAAPISATTDSGTRRVYIERFRRNRIQILTNYNVLTQGFDAPAVRAIYVARPTFSPAVYQQMIGRGLRGPLNGGKEECLIVNIEDNFVRYGSELAFRGFEYLWSERT
jgi:superfamily II DNA or RNA helicase